LAALIPGADLCLFASLFHDVESLRRGWCPASRLERWYRGHRMVGTFTFIYCCEEPLPIQEICATYRVRFSRAHRGPNDRSVAHLVKSFLQEFRAIGTLGGTCPGKVLRSLFLRDGPPIVPSSVTSGIDSGGTARRMTDRCLFLLKFRPINVSCRLRTLYYFLVL